ncbi:MAG: hypothetical protein IT330_12160 [Anaerolineae bacterium]|nr:hypothetical protein [Anaerolineae bacterium]
MTTTTALRLPVPGGDVAAMVDRPAEPPVAGLVICHGANNDLRLSLLYQLAQAAAAVGFVALRFNFGYVERGKPPDPIERGVAELQDAFSALADMEGMAGLPVCIAGKSRGAVVAAVAASVGLPAYALALLSYPLHGASGAMPPQPHLAHLHTPTLFVIGSDDPYCRADRLDEACAVIPGSTEIHLIAGGDHSYQAAPGAERSSEELQDEAVRVALAWLQRQIGQGNL